MPERFTRNVPRETGILARVLDVLACAYLTAFGAAAAAGLYLHPLAVPGCALLGGLALIWILR